MRGWLGLGFMVATACAPPLEGPPVVLVVLDDIGIDKLASYQPEVPPPPTPTLDSLARTGMQFQNAYAHPTCSPSRAALLTGRYGRRYGLGVRIEATTDHHLPLSETALPHMLEQADERWPSAFVGKWHLAGLETERAFEHPTDHGFGHFAGSMVNLNRGGGTNNGYYNWEKVIDGALVVVERYATTDTADDAIDQLTRSRPPRLLVVSFNAAHRPADRPPRELVSGPPGVTEPDIIDDMIEAMDTELGRVLATIERHHPQATLIVIGDNGTSSHAFPEGQDPERSKGTTFEAGVRVPLLVAGPQVAHPGHASDALVHIVDIFPTVAQLAGLDPSDLLDRDGGTLELDGIPLQPWLADPDAPSGREFLFSEAFKPNQGPVRSIRRTLRTQTHKIRWTNTGERSLYALGSGLDEGADLLAVDDPDPEHEAIAQELLAELNRLDVAIPMTEGTP